MPKAKRKRGSSSGSRKKSTLAKVKKDVKVLKRALAAERRIMTVPITTNIGWIPVKLYDHFTLASLVDQTGKQGDLVYAQSIHIKGQLYLKGISAMHNQTTYGNTSAVQGQGSAITTTADVFAKPDSVAQCGDDTDFYTRMSHGTAATATIPHCQVRIISVQFPDHDFRADPSNTVQEVGLFLRDVTATSDNPGRIVASHYRAEKIEMKYKVLADKKYTLVNGHSNVVSVDYKVKIPESTAMMRYGNIMGQAASPPVMNPIVTYIVSDVNGLPAGSGGYEVTNYLPKINVSIRERWHA